MAKNKLVIGDSKDKNEKNQEIKDKISPIECDGGNMEKTPVESPPIPLDEIVWGTDTQVIKKLTDEQLAERRLFVRVRFMQYVECKAVFDSGAGEVVPLPKPIRFNIVDISMGGFGIVCEDEIRTGTVLVYPITLDQITYEIHCEVIYSFEINGKFRAGLKIMKKDKHFIRHLKIFVARISLRSEY